MNHTEVEHRRLMTTLEARSLMDVRHDVYESCLGHKVAKTEDLTGADIRKITYDLSSDEQWGRADFENTKHRYILSLCYQLGWTRMHERLGRMVADNARLGRWLKTYGKYKKQLKKHNPEELGAVIMAMEKMLNNRLK